MTVSKDSRLFAKFTLDFADSRKVLPLSNGAFRCLVEAILWSRKEESDGWLARRLAVAKWSLDDLHELSTNDALNPSLIESEEGWEIHDFCELQDTKAEIDARRERNRVAGQKGGLARGKQGAKRGAKPSASAAPSETQADKETDSLTPKGVKESPRKRGTRLTADWIPPQSVIDAMKAECPGVNLQAEHRKFIDHFTGNGRTMVDWSASWRNWIRRAGERAPVPGAPRVAASDAAFAAAQALKNQNPPRLELA